MGSILKILSEGTTWAIFAMGLFAIVLIVERVQVLYLKFALDVDGFTTKLKGLILGDKIGEALNFASSHAHTPHGRVAKALLERANRDDEAIQQALDISLSESVPLITRRLGYLNMIANVATLFGLLGTITGLILAFQAVSFADPSQKQTLLAQGISLSMNTTAYGLAVAIPVMIVYSFLHSRQSQLIESLSNSAAKILDYLATRNYRGFDGEQVFNSESKADLPPPPPKSKVS